jgi:hypothetical protein
MINLNSRFQSASAPSPLSQGEGDVDGHRQRPDSSSMDPLHIRSVNSGCHPMTLSFLEKSTRQGNGRSSSSNNNKDARFVGVCDPTMTVLAVATVLCAAATPQTDNTMLRHKTPTFTLHQPSNEFDCAVFLERENVIDGDDKECYKNGDKVAVETKSLPNKRQLVERCRHFPPVLYLTRKLEFSWHYPPPPTITRRAIWMTWRQIWKKTACYWP